MNRLLNKTAFITGGSSGIGFATAAAFIAEGANVIITARNKDAIDVATLKLGDKAKGILTDTSDMNAILTLKEQVASITEKLDVLFINAGVATINPIEKVTEIEFDRQFNTNVKGAYFTIQQLLPLMPEGASVVLNCSINAHIGRPDISVYSATKAALLSLVRTLSAELLPRKIRVNALTPGPIETPFRGKIGVPVSIDQANEEARAGVPLGRLGRPEEVAQAAIFLASDESSFTVGTEIIVSGGLGTL